MDASTTPATSANKLGRYAKRFHIRVKIESYAGFHSGPEGVHADLVDLSIGGVGFVTRDQLTPASDVYVSFSIPDINGAPFTFHVKGDLVHSTFVKHHEGYLNGFEYGHLTPTQEEVLKNYISKVILKNLGELRSA